MLAQELAHAVSLADGFLAKTQPGRVIRSSRATVYVWKGVGESNALVIDSLRVLDPRQTREIVEIPDGRS